MKKTITIITLISAFIATSLNAQNANGNNRTAPATIAQQLIASYDSDSSGALDELELCIAVNYLEMKRPFRVFSDPDLSPQREQPAAPKVAVSMRETFDQNEDYQLCVDELSVAIAGLRSRVFNDRPILAMAE